MDPTHHDKIADKLMQYWGKVPKVSHQSHPSMRKKVETVNFRIADLLQAIDELSICIDEGLIE